MRVHHLNCASLCPIGGRLIVPTRMVCHCLLIETDRSGLVLVDTGIGLDDISDPRRRLGRSILFFGRPRLDPEEAARRQVERLGFSPEDVRHILLTHLDLDHAGGLPDFPAAQVHVLGLEHGAAMNPTRFERMRYRSTQWAHSPNWVKYKSGEGEPWFGFECVRDLDGLPPEILLVPLYGHTRGHSAVAVDIGPGGWLLHAGDAYFSHGEIHSLDGRRCPPGLDLFQRIIQVDKEKRLWNQARLRALAQEQGAEVHVFCAHDESEYSAAATIPSRGVS